MVFKEIFVKRINTFLIFGLFCLPLQLLTGAENKKSVPTSGEIAKPNAAIDTVSDHKDEQESTHEDRKTYNKQTVNKFIFKDNHLGISGYMDAYGVYSFNNLSENKQRPYNSNPLYMDEFGFSYGFISFEYENENVRARVSIHGGELVERMYVGERPMYKMFREANAGYLFSKQVSLEMGIFPSIYGSETFINKDNQHATRAIMTDFAPDYMAGVRLNYEPTEHWDLKLEVTNGWQTLSNPEHQKNLGALVVYEQQGKFLINWGTYLGNEAKPNEVARIRSYHNLFAKIFLWRFIFLPMADIYIEKRNAEARTVTAFNLGLSIRYAIADKWGIAARYERLYDPDEINPDLKANNPYGKEDPALPAPTPSGFQADGYTLTLEYLPSSHLTMRLEGRYTESKSPIYIRDAHQPTRTDSFIYSSIAVGF